MKLATPRWWYVRDGAPAPVSRLLLKPLSWIWTYVTARRIATTTPVDPGVPVICVGNLTLGGAGKTPVVRALLERLPGAHALSRGHGGTLIGPVQVDPSVHTAREVGDEPLMLAADAPVWISRDRIPGAQAAAAAGARVVVMDDGHQNPSLAKALSIVVVDGETRDNAWPLGDGAVFPSGPLREPLTSGLARADAVVLMLPSDLAEPEPALLAVFKGKPVLIARLEPAAPPPPGPQLGFAGIGMPWKVETALKAAGCELADFVPFPDHFAYDASSLKQLADRAAVFGAGLVTTEKDWVRLPPAWRAQVVAWPVRAVFQDEAALSELLARF
ncbi:tetraacyldisaccharide 4'-kinase [Phenylobacterium sp.]|uniref:tetraacyldisaccharide 4'-kinase n=1 Tax=Phenylobacterium sp. TaxID=1871053 RepID=UPI0027365921|nr:tetraacyldisaccharide 4'-kinase [Phenylobacterium sp.]MDP3856055.1 tetraacyldisaccharide 4'-kinase [Phenylobacterium sp.]